MAGEQIINKHKIVSIISHRINGKGDDDNDDNDSQDLILNAISERTDKALALINSCNLSTLNTLRQSSNNRSLLHICIGIGWYKAVVQLLKRSVDVNIVDSEQQTPLMLSLNHLKTDIFKRLIQCDYLNINYQTINDGFSILHLVIINDRYQYLKILFQQKKHAVNLDLITNLNKNFLHLMSDFKSQKCLNIIKEYSFNDYLWKQKDNQGYTPLFIALIRWPYSSFTRHLLVLLLNLSSTSLFIQDNHGKTILHWAIFNHHLVKLITDNHQWVTLGSIKDKFNKIPLDYAYEQQLFKSIEYLQR